VAEAIGMGQKSIVKRLYVAVPIFILALLLMVWQLENPDGFNTIWQYFGWGNQTLAVFTLWMLTVYLAQNKKLFVIALIPAMFMTLISSTFVFVSPQALGLDVMIGYPLGLCVTLLVSLIFYNWYRKNRKESVNQ